MSDITFQCPQCGSELTVDASAAGATAECPECSASITVPAAAPASPAPPDKKMIKDPSRSSATSRAAAPPPSGSHTQYKVIALSEGALGTIFLGRSSIPTQKMEAALNREVANGWQVVFQVVEQRRFCIFWKRESIIITLGR